MTDAEKREKQIVLKKLAEMEEELKVRIFYQLVINILFYACFSF